jgi:hypothetical protein
MPFRWFAMIFRFRKPPVPVAWTSEAPVSPFQSFELILGGAAVHRCDNRLAFSLGFSR